MKKIPIRVFPAFWIFSGLIALLLANGNILHAFIWLGIIFVSVLFHEFGHALTARMFGQNPRIELVAMGGLTYHDGEKLKFWKQFLITLAGPVFGFILAIVGYLLLQIPTFAPVAMFLVGLVQVNFIWTIVNLFPVLPLDGGQLMRIVFEAIFHVKGIRYAMMTSVVIASLLAIALIVFQNFFAGAIFFLFAFDNFQAFRRLRDLSESDRSEPLKMALLNAENLMKMGQKEEALHAFDALRLASKDGIIYFTASQYAAFLSFDLGKVKDAYDILLAMKEHLQPEGLCLLHRVAFEQNNDTLVLELAGPVFQLLPQAEVAMRSAYASARLKDIPATIGWLQTAQQCGIENLSEIIKEPAFDTIRSAPEFQFFLNSLS